MPREGHTLIPQRASGGSYEGKSPEPKGVLRLGMGLLLRKKDVVLLLRDTLLFVNFDRSSPEDLCLLNLRKRNETAYQDDKAMQTRLVLTKTKLNSLRCDNRVCDTK